MTRGSLQIAGQNPLEKRVVTISQPQRPGSQDDAADSLFLSVLRRRWMLLAACGLLSLAAATLMAWNFTLPKAESQGELRYVALPPSDKEVYRPPNTLELSEMLRSNENLAELARRQNLQVDLKALREQFEVQTSHLSNIIAVRLNWSDAKQAIDMVNDLMQIACQMTMTNRRQTLARYRQDTEAALTAGNQRVDQFRGRVIELQRQRDAQLKEEGSAGSEAQRLTSTIMRAEELLDQAVLKKAALSQQLSTVRGEVQGLTEQIKQELLRSRRRQVEMRSQAVNAKSPLAARLAAATRELDRFEKDNRALDYVAWQARLAAIGREILGDLDAASLRGIQALEQRLVYEEQRAEQLELELLPMDNELTLLQNRVESLENRLSRMLVARDASLPSFEEAQVRLDDAQTARSNLQEQLDNIQRLETTDFAEMSVLTPASWQTTDFSEGRHKVFVFTFAGCLALLALPIFALEHFYPSGDSAEGAARALGLPLVGRGTFVTQALTHDRVPIHPVNSESMRLLALRIQQSVQGPGALVLFSGLNHDKSSIPMISYLAECLARREERVLIIDACERPQDGRRCGSVPSDPPPVLTPTVPDAPPQPPVEEPRSADGTELVAAARESLPSHGLIGLAEFLHSRDIPPDELICRTSIPGVDMIASGSMGFPREGLASRCLTDLLDECRRRYTLILLAAPSTQQPSDLQMLSARADAILFTLPRQGRPSPQGEAVVRELLDLGAPVIGIVG